MALLNLQNQEANTLINLDQPDQGPPVNDEIANRKADRYDYALGTQSPGRDAIYRNLLVNGENRLRERVAANLDSENAQKRNEMLANVTREAADNGGLSPEYLTLINSLSAEKLANPYTVMEEELSRKVISDLYFDSPNTEQAYNEDPESTDQVFDAAQDIIAKQEVMRNLEERLNSMWGEKSTVGKVGDFLETFIPFKSWSNVGMGGRGVLPGTDQQEQIDRLFALPLDQFQEALTQRLDEIAKVNVNDAYTFLENMQSYSFTDDNIFGVLDALSIVPAGITGRIAGRALRGAERFRNAERVGEELQFGRTSAEDELLLNTDNLTVKPDVGNGIPSREAALNWKTSTSPGALASVFNGIRATTRALARKEINLPEAFASSGKVAQAGILQAWRNIQNEWLNYRSSLLNRSQRDVKKQLDSFSSHLPTFADPLHVLTGGEIKASRAYQERLIQGLVRANKNILSGLVDRTFIERLSERAALKAFEEGQASLRKELYNVSDSIMDIEFVDSGKAPTLGNVNSVSAKLGRPTPAGPLPFRSELEAKNYADNQLRVKDYTIEGLGEAYFVRVTRDLDETTEGVRDFLIDTDNVTPESFFNQFIGGVRTTNDVLSQAQKGNRKTLVHGTQGAFKAFSQITKPIQALSNRSKKRLNRFVNDVLGSYKRFDNQGNPLPGNLIDTLSEFETIWHQSFNKLPTAKEAQAYFAYVKANEFYQIANNVTRYRMRARQGIHNFEVRLGEDYSETFGGKFVDDFDPKKVSNDAGILFIDPANGPVFYKGAGSKGRQKRVEETLNPTPGQLPQPAAIGYKGGRVYRHKGKFTSEQRMQEIITKEDLERQGYRVIQVENPYDSFVTVGEDYKIVNFVIAKDYRTRRLTPTDFYNNMQMSGEALYDYSYVVKQPMIRRLDGKNIYTGDRTIQYANTQEEVQKLAENYEQARQLFRNIASSGDYDTYEEFVNSNLPVTADDLAVMFADDTIDQTLPFTHVVKGEHNLTIDNNVFREKLGNIENGVNNPYNLAARHTVFDDDPVVRFSSTKTIDPAGTMAKMGQSVAHNEFVEEYIVASMEAYAREFADILAIPPDQLRRNPAAAIFHPVFQPNASKSKVAAAKNFARAFEHLLSTRTAINESLDTLSEKVYNFFFNRFGEGTADFVQNHLMERIDDPVRLFRSAAFHLRLGLFNITQLWKQAQTTTIIMSLAHPKAALPASMTYFPSRILMRSSESERMINHVDRMMRTFGWKEGEFAEAYRAMRRSGIDIISGDHALREDLLQPQIIKSKAGVFLDKGAVFFREGDRVNRIIGFMAAYKEWRLANPTAQLDRRAMQRILDREDNLNVNMTRASNSNLERGAMNIPLQFFSYNIRLMNLIMSKRITPMERRKLILSQSLLYGIPIGVGGTLFPVWPWYEEIRQGLMERTRKENPLATGPEEQSNFAYLLHNGLISLALKLTTGEDFAVGSSWGPTGLSIFKDMIEGGDDGSFVSIMGGVSGGVISDILSTTNPVLRTWTNLFGSKGERRVALKDIEDAFRTASSVNAAYKLYYAMSVAKLVQKGEIVLDDSTTFEGAMALIFGIQPQAMDDFGAILESNREAQGAQDHAREQMIKYWRRSFQAQDEDERRAFENQAQAWWILGDFPQNEYEQIFRDAVRGYENIVDQVQWDYFVKHGITSSMGAN